jgi:hypothetical protein
MSEPFLEGFKHRLALEADADDIAALMDAAIDAVDGSPPRRQIVPPDRAGGAPWIRL